jgi:hypothetical protein
VSGNHRTPTGGYRTPSGEYRSASGGYRTPSGEYRTSSGAHRSASGSHRVDQGAPSKWRLFLVLAGVTAGVAVCAVSAVFVLMLGDRPTSDSSGRVSAQQPGVQRGSTAGERTAVPDACSLVTDQQAEKLVPKFDRNQLNSASSTDTHSQCAWTLFSTDSGHQLTVELRVIAGTATQSATTVAKQTFATEQASDDAGKGGLSTTERITAHQSVQGVGDAAYAAYSVDDAKGVGSQGYGDAGFSARVANVIVTVHYGGSEKGGPMKEDKATAGATDTAKTLIRALAKTP